MTTAEEKWREKPPSAATVWLFGTVAVLGFTAEMLTDSWWKAFACGAAVLCGILAWTAWRARRHARRPSPPTP